MRQPSTHRESLLPVADVGSRKFEGLCRDLATLAFEGLVVRASLKRTVGVEQFSADVEGFDEASEPAVVISTTSYHRVRAWDFRKWLDKFVEHLDGHWAGKRIRHFILAISHRRRHGRSMPTASRAATRRAAARIAGATVGVDFSSLPGSPRART